MGAARDDAWVIRARTLVAAPADHLAELLGVLAAPDGQAACVSVPACAGARLRWSLEPLRAATGVELALELREPLWPLRLALRLGGRRWLARELERAVVDIATLAAAPRV